MTPNRDQTIRLAQLKADFAYYADAAKELDSDIDMIANRGSRFSNDAHEQALEKLRDMLGKVEAKRDEAKEALHNAEGWLTCR